MNGTFDFYDQRAREAAADAHKATLDNVRERFLRAEKSWRALADQARKVLVNRKKEEAVRAERREREALEAAISGSEAQPRT